MAVYNILCQPQQPNPYKQTANIHHTHKTQHQQLYTHNLPDPLHFQWWRSNICWMDFIFTIKRRTNTHVWWAEEKKVLFACVDRCVGRHDVDIEETYRRNKRKSRQHPDFPGGHPPEYYPSLRLLNFTERTGYGVLSLRWPSTSYIRFTHDTYISMHITYHTFSVACQPHSSHGHTLTSLPPSLTTLFINKQTPQNSTLKERNMGCRRCSARVEWL